VIELLQFITRNRAFILFALLEILSFWCVYRYNNYASAVYFNTSNYYAGKTLAAANAVKEYTNLREVNKDLATENARLNQLVAYLQSQHLGGTPNYKADSVVAARYQVITVAKVIGKSVNQFNNTLTIDKGTAAGLKPGMGVISATGVVGTVRSCNEHFSVITSILHGEMRVSSKIKRTNDIGSAKWEGTDPDYVELLDVPLTKSVKMGDTVVTSNYNSVYPPGVMVGIIKKLGIKPDKAFHDIHLHLLTDFRNLSYVYIIENKLKDEQEQLETPITPAKK
jgi:rod shape-determining protein MreC